MSGSDGSADPPSLPTGTVTFLRTDVEGSMRLTRPLGSGWDALNATHLQIIRDAVDAHDGVPVRTEGDAMFAAFGEAGAAVSAAIDAQRALHDPRLAHAVPASRPDGPPLGRGAPCGDDYGGFDVNRVRGIAAVGHGGQIVLSETTRSLVQSALPPGVRVRDLGRHALKDIPVPGAPLPARRSRVADEFPPVRVAGSSDGNLPDRLTTFVGRSTDLATLGELLDDHRLVTLTGPGGIGKTSLRVELARSRETTLPDGAWLVALDGVTDPALVTSAIARTLGLFDGVDRPAADALPAFLGDDRYCSLLDNFEHLLEAAGDVVDARPRLARARGSWSPAGPPSTSVASRSTRSGHWPWGTARGYRPGDRPELDAATRLFIDRARAVRPDWEPGPDLPIVAEICALLDGLPLGIELAAARLSLLPPAAIRDRLAAHLPLPGSGPRDAPARQRTLEGAIDWSHDLLSAEERATFHALAVFEGGFDVDQAEPVIDSPDGVGDDALDRLIALAEHSLIARDQAPSGDAGRLAGSGVRFGLLKTVHGYALDRLIADGREGDCGVATRSPISSSRRPPNDICSPPNSRPGSIDWRSIRPTCELPSVGASMPARPIWPSVSSRRRGATGRSSGSWRKGASGRRRRSASPGADAPTIARVRAIGAAGSIAYWRSERDRAVEHYREQLALAQRLQDTAGTADAWFNLASATFVAGDHDESVQGIAEARRLYVELGDDRGVNRCDWDVSNLIMETEGPAAMLVTLQPILERAIALGDAAYVVLCGGSMSWAILHAWRHDDRRSLGHPVDARFVRDARRRGIDDRASDRGDHRHRVRSRGRRGADHGRVRGPVRAIWGPTADRPRIPDPEHGPRRSPPGDHGARDARGGPRARSTDEHR